MNPQISVKSRYSLANINPSFYSTLPLNSGTSIGTKGGGIGQGYVFVPYILVNSSSVIVDGKNSEMLRRIRITAIRKERKEKINKLKW